MTITDISPSTAVGGQWIYIEGSDFDLTNTQVYFGTVQCVLCVITSTSMIAAMVPDGCPSTCNIKIVDGLNEVVSSMTFSLDTITQPPIIDSVYIDMDTDWVGVIGDNFVWNNTTITIDEQPFTGSVDAPSICGARKDTSLTVTSVVIQTPYGSVTHSV
jgi:hypothetical protein